jgi:hypothetical protein
MEWLRTVQHLLLFSLVYNLAQQLRLEIEAAIRKQLKTIDTVSNCD